MQSSKAKLYVVEGADGVGKTTVIEEMVRILKELNPEQEVVVISGLRATPFGVSFYDVLKGIPPELLNNPKVQEFIADGASRVHLDSEAVINRHLADGRSVIMDRWIPSFLVYQHLIEQTKIAKERESALLEVLNKQRPMMIWVDDHVSTAVANVRSRQKKEYHDHKDDKHFATTIDTFRWLMGAWANNIIVKDLPINTPPQITSEASQLLRVYGATRINRGDPAYWDALKDLLIQRH